jgi:hypothetical protein
LVDMTKAPQPLYDASRPGDGSPLQLVTTWLTSRAQPILAGPKKSFTVIRPYAGRAKASTMKVWDHRKGCRWPARAYWQRRTARSEKRTTHVLPMRTTVLTTAGIAAGQSPVRLL